MASDYYCYVCNAFVSPSQIRHVQNDEVYCNICKRQGFVEKINRNDSFIQSYRQQPRIPQQGAQSTVHSHLDPFAEILGVPFQRLINEVYTSAFPSFLTQPVGPTVTRPARDSGYNGMQYFQFDLNLDDPSRQQFTSPDLMSLLGQIMVNPGDNTTMNQIIQYIMENDTNRHGSPPAAKKVVNSLKEHVLTKEEVETLDSCAVCHEKYQEGDKVHYITENREVCNHCFHIDCIIPWLKEHNSCPVCRYELPTDDPEYDARRADLRERIVHQVSQAAQASRADSSDRSRSASSNLNATNTTSRPASEEFRPNPRVSRTATVINYSNRSQRQVPFGGRNQSFSNQYMASRRMVPLSFDPLGARAQSGGNRRSRPYRHSSLIDDIRCTFQ